MMTFHKNKNVCQSRFGKTGDFEDDWRLIGKMRDFGIKNFWDNLIYKDNRTLIT